MTLALIFSMFLTVLSAPPNRSIVVFEAEEVNPYEAIWNAVCQVESSGNQFAIGDKHLKHHSYGISQIRQSRLDDFYRQTGIRYYEFDMFDTVKSKSVFIWYASQIGPYNNERIAREWNSGPSGMKRKSTLKYWNKIEKFLYRYRSRRKDC